MWYCRIRQQEHLHTLFNLRVKEATRARRHCAILLIISVITGETIADSGLTGAGCEVGHVDFSYGLLNVRYI
jgi:hypothetical protein